MPGNDFNRVIPGIEVEKFSEENYLDLQKRFVKVEQILAENVRQWNAPTLLSMLTASNYQIQFGKFNYVFGGGSTAQNFTLPTAWGSEHVVFQISFRPYTSWDTSFRVNGCGTNGLSLGAWGIAGSTAQTYEASWLSIGKSVL